MQNKYFKKLMSMFLALGLCSIVFAGPNKAASVAVDYNHETIEVVTEAPKAVEGGKYTFAVIVNDVSDLHSYSVKIKYDEKVLEFADAKEKLTSNDCFIETGGGKLLTFIVNPKVNEVEVATALKGKGENVTVSGTGALAYFYFNGIAEGSAEIEVVEVKLLDSEGALDKLTRKRAKAFNNMQSNKEGVVSYEDQ